jgi:predicted metal-dependent hydrolase
MTEIPIDPVLRAAVLKEMGRDHLSNEDMADAIIRAINRTTYLNAVGQQAKRYAEMSRAGVPYARAAFVAAVEHCCCVLGEGPDLVHAQYPCRGCQVHHPQTRLLCFAHRKQERNKL